MCYLIVTLVPNWLEVALELENKKLLILCLKFLNLMVKSVYWPLVLQWEAITSSICIEAPYCSLWANEIFWSCSRLQILLPHCGSIYGQCYCWVCRTRAESRQLKRRDTWWSWHAWVGGHQLRGRDSAGGVDLRWSTKGFFLAVIMDQ